MMWTSHLEDLLQMREVCNDVVQKRTSRPSSHLSTMAIMINVKQHYM